ncbi:MAG: hypothetical protein M1395_00010 [Bacteroidetes bacterium]|nr:hypothetical protein [Bacteroidota bacterium]
MPLPNRVSAVLSQADLEAALGGIKITKEKLPFLIEISRGEKRRLVRIDDAAQPWTARMLEAATQHPGMLPANFDLQEMQKDVELWRQLIQVGQALTSLKQLVDDTCDAVAVDAYSSALAVYRLGKDTGIGMEGLEDLMDEFGKRFARKTNKSTATANAK